MRSVEAERREERKESRPELSRHYSQIGLAAVAAAAPYGLRKETPQPALRWEAFDHRFETTC